MAKKGIPQRAAPKQMPQPADLKALGHYATHIREAIRLQWIAMKNPKKRSSGK